MSMAVPSEGCDTVLVVSLRLLAKHWSAAQPPAQASALKWPEQAVPVMLSGVLPPNIAASFRNRIFLCASRIMMGEGILSITASMLPARPLMDSTIFLKSPLNSVSLMLLRR